MSLWKRTIEGYQSTDHATALADATKAINDFAAVYRPVLLLGGFNRYTGSQNPYNSYAWSDVTSYGSGWNSSIYPLPSSLTINYLFNSPVYLIGSSNDATNAWYRGIVDHRGTINVSALSALPISFSYSKIRIRHNISVSFSPPSFLSSPFSINYSINSYTITYYDGSSETITLSRPVTGTLSISGGCSNTICTNFSSGMGCRASYCAAFTYTSTTSPIFDTILTNTKMQSISNITANVTAPYSVSSTLLYLEYQTASGTSVKTFGTTSSTFYVSLSYVPSLQSAKSDFNQLLSPPFRLAYYKPIVLTIEPFLTSYYQTANNYIKLSALPTDFQGFLTKILTWYKITGSSIVAQADMHRYIASLTTSAELDGFVAKLASDWPIAFMNNLVQSSKSIYSKFKGFLDANPSVISTVRLKSKTVTSASDANADILVAGAANITTVRDAYVGTSGIMNELCGWAQDIIARFYNTIYKSRLSSLGLIKGMAVLQSPSFLWSSPFTIGTTTYDTQQEYLSALLDNYTQSYNDIQVYLYIKTVYEMNRMFMTDAEFASDVITRIKVMYGPGASYTAADLLGILKSLMDSGITKYSQISTLSMDSITSMLQTNGSITTTTAVAKLDDVTSVTTLTALVPFYTKYYDVSGQIVTYLNTLKKSVTNIMSQYNTIKNSSVIGPSSTDVTTDNLSMDATKMDIFPKSSLWRHGKQVVAKRTNIARLSNWQYIKSMCMDKNGLVWMGGDFFTGGNNLTLIGSNSTSNYLETPIKAEYLVSWDRTFNSNNQMNIINRSANGTVTKVVSDASGNVYISGQFTAVGGSTMGPLVRWNGTSFSNIPLSATTYIYDMVTDKLGNIYIGGSFTLSVGSMNTKNIARWNGSSWSGFGNSLYFQISQNTMAVDASGNIYVANQDPARASIYYAVLRWNGSAWVNISPGVGFSNQITALAIDSGNNVYVSFNGTALTNGTSNLPGTYTNIVKWNGTAWQNCVSGQARTLTIDENDQLYITSNNNYALSVYDGKNMTSLGTSGSDYSVLIDPRGPIYVAGYYFDIAAYNTYNGTINTGIQLFNLIYQKYLLPYATLIYRGIYELARLYLEDSSLFSSAATRIKAYTDQTFTMTEILASMREIMNASIQYYGTWSGTNVTDSATDKGLMDLVDLRKKYLDLSGGLLPVLAVTKAAPVTSMITNYRIAATNAGITIDVSGVNADISGSSFSSVQPALGLSGEVIVYYGKRVLSAPNIQKVGSTDITAANTVNAIVMDSAGNIYVGGQFSLRIGSTTHSSFMRWNGSSWTSWAFTQFGGYAIEIKSMAIDKRNNFLYIGGYFGSVGGVTSNCVARWNGTAWTAMAGMPDGVFSICVDNVGTVYAGCWNTQVYRWTGSAWSSIYARSSGWGVQTILPTSLVTDSNNNLYIISGNYANPSYGITLNSFVNRWNGTAWTQLGTSFSTFMNTIFIDSSNTVYVGGQNFLRRWNGSSWTNVGSNDPSSGYVRSICIDSQNTLYISVDNATANGVYVANGLYKKSATETSWSRVLTTDNEIRALVPDALNNLYMGGFFKTVNTSIVGNNLKYIEFNSFMGSQKTYPAVLDALIAKYKQAMFRIVYPVARKYITLDDLQAATRSTIASIYAGTVVSDAEYIAARIDVLNTVIARYYKINKTTYVEAIEATIPPGDVPNATADLDALETKFLTGSTALWPALMTSMRTYVSTYISTTYKNARGSISTSSPNFVNDATITRDAGYTSATLTSNQDASGVVRFIVNTSDSSGLRTLTGFQFFSTNATPSVLYTPPSSISGFTTITNNSSYSFTSGSNRIILTTSPTSGWIAGGTPDLRNTILSTGTNPRSNDVILQFPSFVNPTSVYVGLRGTGIPGFTVSGANSVSGPWTNLFTISTLRLTNTATTSMNLGITTPDSYTFLRFQPTAQITLMNGLGYWGTYMSSTLSSEYSLISQLYSKYKSFVDAIVQAVRQPALSKLDSFQLVYASLTQCLPTDVATNSQYATVYQAYQASLSPSGAPSGALSTSTDANAIMELTDASAINAYTTKYETAIRTLYNALRTKQISTVRNYTILYNQYMFFSTDASLADYNTGMSALATQTGLADNGATDLSNVQALPIATETYSPIATDISGLAAICTTYNGTSTGANGRYQLLQTFLKTNIEIFIRRYDVKYASLSQQAKNANPYTTPLQPSSPAGTGSLPETITPQQLLTLMVSYGGFAGTPLSLSTDAGAPAPAQGATQSYKTTYTTARDQADALTVFLDFSTLIQDIARSKTLLIAIDPTDATTVNAINQAISSYASNAYDSNIALAVRDKSIYQDQIGSALSLAAKNMQTIISDYKTLYEAYTDFRRDVGGHGFLQSLPDISGIVTAPTSDTVPELTYTAAASEDYTTDSVGSLSLYGSVKHYATFQSMRETYMDAYESLVTTIRENLNAFLTEAVKRITTLKILTTVDTSSFGTLNLGSLALQSAITTSSNSMASWFVSLFYTNTYIPGIRYIRSTQIPSSVATFATTCEKLGTGQASRTLIKDAVPAINDMTTTLVAEFETAYTTWTGRGMQSATQLPETMATDKTTASETARTTYLELWSTLLNEIHAFTKKSVQTANYLQIWSQTPTNQRVSALFQGIPATTSGLGLAQ